MSNKAHALSRDELIRVLTAYKGVTTAAGAENGTTLIDANLKDNPSISASAIPEKTILIMSGDASGEDKGATSFDNDTGAVTLQGTGFSVQIKAGTIFRILNISSIEIDVANIDTKIGTNADAAGTTTIFAWLVKLFEQGGQGGFYYGKVTQIDDATHFRVAGLTGFGDAYFANTYRVYVVRDAAGLEAAPQGEMQPCSGYDSDDGIFTYTAFTVALAVDDEVLLIHERIAEIADLVAALGQMDAAATNDNMSDIATTSALAKLRLILNRLSPDAFSATIHAGARTSLDTMLAEMAKYFVADGGGFDLKINNGVNRDNLNLIMRDFFTVIGILDTSIWQPTIGGGTQVTVVAAIQALANYWAPLGAGLDIKINNGVNRDDLKNLLKDYFAVLGISDTSIWQPVIAGGARTTVVAAIQALANLWTPPGEGLDIKINNGTNKDTLKEVLKDFFTMIGCLDTNVFNPIIGGSPRTTFDAAFAAIGTALAALVGTTGIFHEQADVPLSFNTVSGSETNVLNLVAGATRYIVRSLRLKFATPGANTITVRLYELVNDGLVEVDSFEVTSANFGTYHSLMDMFGMAQLAGDNLKVTTRVSAGGNIATLGQYSYAKTNV